MTQLCRDVCHYCTFAHAPRKGEPAYLSIERVLAIARAGAAAGCKEALFTLGDKPEDRYHVAREELSRLGHDSTLSYLAEAARVVFNETGLLPHLNPGLLDASDLAALRQVSVSQGIMLESSSERLCERGGPHFWFAGQESCSSARNHPPGGRGRCTVYDRYPDRHRRDARGTH
ncbi:radical SAM protein [Undibacterium arcticum]